MDPSDPAACRRVVKLQQIEDLIAVPPVAPLLHAAGWALPSAQPSWWRLHSSPPMQRATVVVAAPLVVVEEAWTGPLRRWPSLRPIRVAPPSLRLIRATPSDPRHPVVRPRTSALSPSRSVAAAVFFFPICDRVCVPIAHRRRLAHHRHRLRQHRLPHLLRLCCRRGLRRNWNACLCCAPSSARRPTSARLRHHRSGGSTFDIAFAIVVFASHAVGLINRSREPPS